MPAYRISHSWRTRSALNSRMVTPNISNSSSFQPHTTFSEPALADVIRGDELLCRDDRMDQRRVHVAEHRQPLRPAEQTGGPCDCFQCFALVVGVAAVAFPTADRQHELDACFVRHACEARQSGQLPLQRSGTMVTARPDEQLAPDRPSFSRLPLYSARRSCMVIGTPGPPVP